MLHFTIVSMLARSSGNTSHVSRRAQAFSEERTRLILESGEFLLQATGFDGSFVIISKCTALVLKKHTLYISPSVLSDRCKLCFCTQFRSVITGKFDFPAWIFKVMIRRCFRLGVRSTLSLMKCRISRPRHKIHHVARYTSLSPSLSQLHVPVVLRSTFPWKRGKCEARDLNDSRSRSRDRF